MVHIWMSVHISPICLLLKGKNYYSQYHMMQNSPCLKWYFHAYLVILFECSCPSCDGGVSVSLPEVGISSYWLCSQSWVVRVELSWVVRVLESNCGTWVPTERAARTTPQELQDCSRPIGNCRLRLIQACFSGIPEDRTAHPSYASAPLRRERLFLFI